MSGQQQQAGREVAPGAWVPAPESPGRMRLWTADELARLAPLAEVARVVQL